MAWTFQASLPAPGAGPGAWRSWAAIVVRGAAADLAAGLGRPCAMAQGPAPVGSGHFHHMPELFIQIAGRRRFRCPRGELVLAPGGILAVPPLTVHAEQVVGDDPGANLVLSVQSGWLSVHAGLRVRGSLQPVAAEAVPAADHAFGDGCLLRACAADGDPRLWLRAFLVWAGGTLTTAPLAAPGRHARVGRVLALIQYDLGRGDLSVSGLAATLGCTPGHLTRQFREDLGEPLVAYIQRVRLERARDLLRDPALPVRTAAHLVGIDDPAYFSRLFRRRFGVPPSRRSGGPA